MKSYIQFITEKKEWEYSIKFEETQDYIDLVNKEKISDDIIDDYFDELKDDLFKISTNWNYLDREYAHSKVYFSKQYEAEKYTEYKKFKEHINELDHDIKLFDQRLQIFLDGTDYELVDIELKRYPGDPRFKDRRDAMTQIFKLLVHFKRKHNNQEIKMGFENYEKTPSKLKDFVKKLKDRYVNLGMDPEFFDKYVEITPESENPDIDVIYVAIFMPNIDDMHVIGLFTKHNMKGVANQNVEKRVMFDYNEMKAES